MKCPKCHYLSFDPEPRCRNCGYTLTLDPDLEIHPAAAERTERDLGDLTLRDAGAAAGVAEPSIAPTRARRHPAPTPPSTPSAASLAKPGPFDEFTIAPPAGATDPEPSAPAAFPPPPPAPRRPHTPVTPAPARRRVETPAPTSELPLFVKGLPDSDAPPAPGRGSDVRHVDRRDEPAPLPPAPAPSAPASRRAPRKSEPSSKPLGPLDRDLLEGLQRIEEKARRQAEAEFDTSRHTGTATGATAGRRAAAAAVDALLIAGLAAGILWMTLRWVDLPWGQWAALPPAPLVLFLTLIVAGYLFMFTAAGGQTAGKMLMHIRVVDAGPAATSVTLSQALYRSLLAIPSVLAFGVGFMPALTGEHLALHDRLARTRVVRA